MIRSPVRAVLSLAALSLAGSLALPATAVADKYRNPTAIFAGLDKITGRIISFEVAVDETVQFGALQLTPKVCYSRPATESPQTTSFVEVDEITLSNDYRRIFNGWMFAGSPGLSAVEHPVYDLWLTECKGAAEKDLIKTAPEQIEVSLPEPAINRPGKPQDDKKTATRVPNRSTTAGPILPGQPLEPLAPRQAQRPAPSQRFFPTNTGGLLFDPASRNN